MLIASRSPVHVKITDFGISKSQIGTFLRMTYGTEGYYAPEMSNFLRREIKGFKGGDEYTTAVDIWALGCLLHEMLTSELPFLRRTTTYYEDSNESGIQVNTIPREQDLKLLMEFCGGRKEDLTESLERFYLEEPVVELLQCLLVPRPDERISVGNALSSSWF